MVKSSGKRFRAREREWSEGTAHGEVGAGYKEESTSQAPSLLHVRGGGGIQ